MPRSELQRARKDREAAPFRGKLEKYIAAYGAAAAGVGIVASAQITEAEIIYTPANESITRGFILDVDGDGAADFVFPISCNSERFSSGRVSACVLYASGAHIKHKNMIWATPENSSPLPPDILVGNPGKFTGVVTLVTAVDSTFRGSHRHFTDGPWANLTSYYLGLQFTNPTGTQFGWARLNVGPGLTTTLTGYAYETVPGAPILTGKEFGGGPPQPDASGSASSHESSRTAHGTLGQLALGASSTSVLRRR
jgi:hypothetical protein